MWVGEALSLWLEGFDMAGLTITLHDRGEMENLAEIKTVSSPRRLDCTQELMDLFTGYICEYHTAEIHTNHVFLKLKGGMEGNAMDYRDVDNLFRTLRKKTGIRVTPHMFRHTSLSLLYSAGWEPEMLRQRAGHKNIYTTLDTYVHPSEEEVAEAFKKTSKSLKMPSIGREAGQ
jgi:integrase/recombinase XerD